MKTPTSEQRYGLPEQPENTCGMIDAVLKDVDRLSPDFEGVDRSLMRRVDREKPEDDVACDLIDDLVYRLEQADEAKDNMDTRSIHAQMEKVRSNVIDIRAWGQSWKDLAKENLDKVETIETPWDGIVLWWNERCDDRWRGTWVYRTCFAPREPLHSKRPVPVII